MDKNKNSHPTLVSDADFRKRCNLAYDSIFKVAFLNDKNIWILEFMLNELTDAEEIINSIIETDHLKPRDDDNYARECDARILSPRVSVGHIHSIIELNSVFGMKQEIRNIYYMCENVATSDRKDKNIEIELFNLFNLNLNVPEKENYDVDTGYISNARYMDPATFRFNNVNVDYYKDLMYNTIKQDKYEEKGGNIKHIGLLRMNEAELRVCAKVDPIAKEVLDIYLSMKSDGSLRQLFTAEQEEYFKIKDAEDMAREDEKEKTARKMLAKNVSIDDICSFTGLTPAHVASLV